MIQPSLWTNLSAKKKFAAGTAKFVSSFYLGITIVHRLSAGVFFGQVCPVCFKATTKYFSRYCYIKNNFKSINLWLLWTYIHLVQSCLNKAPDFWDKAHWVKVKPSDTNILMMQWYNIFRITIELSYLLISFFWARPLD